MRGCLITGTDTGVGKTVVTAAMLAALRAAGEDALALKPVLTGTEDPPDPVWPPDHELLATVAGVAVEAVNFASYGPAVSPHLAVALSGRALDVEALAARIRAAAPARAPLLVEGVGGLLVPLDGGWDVRALARALGLALIVVARPGLGTINHTLLTLEAARAAGLRVAGVVLNRWPDEPGEIERSNRETIARLGGVEVAVLGELAGPEPALLAAAGAGLPLSRWLGEAEPSGGERDSAALVAADRRHVWHPFTAQQSWGAQDPVLVIERGEGATLWDRDGRAYLDGVSSLWCNVHGHRHPVLDAAVRAQLDRVAHSTMLGLTHPPAVELAQRLAAIAPAGLTRVFYSDSGSTAVEIALKIAFQYWAQQGQPERRRFVCLENAYHGDTIGAVSVGGIDLFHAVYGPLLFEAHRARAGDAGDLARLLEARGEEVAAVIVEPLVQGAAGMLLQPEGYLREVRALCDAHGVLLICDEVATGFGRTGRMFACEHEQVSPDLMCVGKGLTGGYLPLAATLASERIYAGFLGDPSQARTFFHGHTFTGNPLACAAALATLEVFERERTLARLQPKIERLRSALHRRVAPLTAVGEIRQRGFMVGIELRDFAPEERTGHRIAMAARELGAIIRPLGDVVVLMPPLAITEGELDRLVEITARAIVRVTGADTPKKTGVPPRQLAGAARP